ncbi:MAG: polyprenyl synthetase family protein [Cyanosarcina radialis HA8281-LM2]|jgi:geranylgeranyl pyrophosphate synthase/predicted secreted hydrolase|nr:polyprenyl synthetase family protein [Cyanosarcina radialis HA8281-LM2]
MENQLPKNSCLGIKSFPDDWPGDGAIDLKIHDLPHRSSTIEWWYVNSHLVTVDGREFSVFAAFFRSLEEAGEPKLEPVYCHSLTWALIDASEQKYYRESLLDRRGPGIALNKMQKDFNTTDPFLKKALREVFEQGKVTLPDLLLKKNAEVSAEELKLDYDGNRFVKLTEGCYQLKLADRDGIVGCELLFTLKKPPARHGNNGVVRGTTGEEMFYYFVPSCRVEGTLTVAGKTLEVKTAKGWYDREFGRPEERQNSDRTKSNVAWNWIAVQLDNGCEINAYDLIDIDKDTSCGHYAIVIDPKGDWQCHREFTFKPLENWTSSRTFENYPIRWLLQIPALDLSLTVEAAFPAQEFVTLISHPGFWEGRVTIAGEMKGKTVRGIGFIERSGFSKLARLEDFLKAVGQQTRTSIQNLLPLAPTTAQLKKLIGSESQPHRLQGLDSQQYSQALLEPIRTIVDRGGKAWRSYAPLACIDLVGGDSSLFLDWLGVPELLHVGSLIVDDVQDRSLVRRGGPTCHHLYGEPLAINAGNACYFLGEILLRNSNISAADKLRIYQLYFDTLRAAHAGQALDLSGFSYLMPEVVDCGTGELLEARILSMYCLKSGVPASASAKMGAILGGGSQEQIDRLGGFFEALGIAFQIVDDVLNLRGFENNLKSKGEDITAGKITLPVAKAMSALPLKKRQQLWKSLGANLSDPKDISAVIDSLEACGAITACVQQANGLVESAWQELDRLVPDSDVKMRLRSFSWYVLQRHY